ncbi:MAG: response regulator [Anaerolineae bacterium]|nr:response regulator transcription factor [Anaerolineales bacterium]MCQ3972541.1 response regulator [Anaerolineae bacterium]
MRVLIADDDAVSRRLLEVTLTAWGYEVKVTTDGNEAWQALQAEDAPRLAILDWMMPGLDGSELCRRMRQNPDLSTLYLILLTGKGRQEDIVAGLEAGADDYLIKPFDAKELRARLQVGVRVVQLQCELANRVKELEAALAQVEQLESFLPICSYCKKIRDDENYWQQLESYIETHFGTAFTHSICPDCYQKHVAPELAELRRRRGLA